MAAVVEVSARDVALELVATKRAIIHVIEDRRDEPDQGR